MPNTLRSSSPNEPGRAQAQERPRSAPPAMRIYNALRRTKGYSHEEASRHLRRTLKRYFRAA